MLKALLIAASLLAMQGGQEQILAPEAIEAAVLDAVRARLSEEGSRAVPTIAGRLQAQRLPQGRVMIHTDRVAGRMPRPRIAVHVRFQVDGVPVRQMTVWVEMRDHRTVPVYAQDYPRGTPAADIVVVDGIADMTCCPGPLADGALDGNVRLASSVNNGAPVMRRDLEEIPVVAANSEVVMHVERGAVALRTRGLALADAGIGDVVAVRPKNARTVVQTRVIGDQEVRVEN